MQEAGRAGRDGEPARATLLYRVEDKRVHDYFLRDKYAVAKAEGGASAKRAALVVTVLWLTVPASVTTDSGKVTTTATKPAATKPAKR